MADEQKYEIFLSFSSWDGEWVSQFADLLREAGKGIWSETLDARQSEQWHESIRRALKGSKTCVFILSSRSIDDPWIYLCYGAAIADKKSIIQILIDDFDLSRVIYFNTLSKVHVEADFKRAAKHVLRCLDQYVDADLTAG